VDTAAWRDVVAAAPDAFRATHELAWAETPTHAIVTCRGLTLSLLNRVLELGLRQEPTEAQVSDALAALQEAAPQKFYVVHTLPQVQPPGLQVWLETRHMALRSVWDRLTLPGAPEPRDVPRSKGLRIELVDAGLANVWALFMKSLFQLPVDELLRALVGRAGWHHAMLRRQGLVMATRSMYITPDKDAWLGLELPIPGGMAPSFEEDARLTQTLLNIAAAQGVRSVVAEIPFTHPQQRTPAYEKFAEMGFKYGYARRNYTPLA
jgi:hypothetical protein